MKQIIAVLSFILLYSLGAQEEQSFRQISTNPKTIMDYFVTCPYFSYEQNNPGSVIHVDFAKPQDSMGFNFVPKKLLLQGISGDYSRPVKSFVVDPAHGYIHIVLEQNDLTMACFDQADKSRIIALRISDLSGQFENALWGFFTVKNGKWMHIPDDQILPENWLKAFFTRDIGQTDKDYLSVTDWDMGLPQIGTTAVLMPKSYETDLESPTTKIPIEGTGRTVFLYKYYDWFREKFQNKNLELLWDMKNGRFNAGKITCEKIPLSAGLTGRGIDEVLQNPQNVWEYFLTSPEIQVSEDNGIKINFEDKDADIQRQTELLVAKQKLFGGGLGDLMLNYVQSDSPLIISIPESYLNFNLMEQGSSGKESGGSSTMLVKNISFTLVSFEKADKSKIIGYRLWSLSSKYNGPNTEYNQITVNFYLIKDSTRTSLAPESILPMDMINGFVLKGESKKDQALQQAIVWDVEFSKSGTMIHIVPWHLEDQTPAKMKRLADLFGSKENIQKAFQDFKDRWYHEKALALNWNKSKGIFDPPALVAWMHSPWK